VWWVRTVRVSVLVRVMIWVTFKVKAKQHVPSVYVKDT